MDNQTTLKHTESGKTWAIVVGVVFCLSLPAISIWEELTTSRLVLLLFFGLAIYRLNINNYRIPFDTLVPIITASIAFVIYVISLVLKGGLLWPVFSWLFLGLLGSLIAYCVYQIKSNRIDYFIWTIAICSLLIWVFVTFKMAESGELLSGGTTALRNYARSFFPTGLNRFMNMMVVLSAIPLTALFFGFSNRLRTKVFFLLPAFFTLYYSLIAGSRQSLVVLLILLILLVLIKTKSLFKFIYYAIIVFLVLFLVLYVLVSQDLLDFMWIEQRFIQSLVERDITEGDITRLYILTEGLKYSFFEGGVGPGNFEEFVGRPPHNGYLGFLAEPGIIMGIIGLFLIFGIIIATFIINTLKKQSITPLSNIAWVVFFTLAIFMVNLNDLFREPLFWATLGVAVGASINNKTPLASEEENR